MTSRQQFERWAKREALLLDTTYEVTRNGPRAMYVSDLTAQCWFAWQAGRRAKGRPIT